MKNDKIIGEEHRKRALDKMRLEMKKDIANAESIAVRCGLSELLLLCYYFRLSRIFVKNSCLTNANIYEFQIYDDALMYAIGLVAKHGNWASECNIQDSLKKFNEDGLIEELMTFAKSINSKFDHEKMLHVVNLRVMGERDQTIIIETELEELEPKRVMYLDYGVRLEQFTHRSKEDFKPIPKIVAQVRQDVEGLEEQFAEQFGLSIDRYSEGWGELKDALEYRLKAAFYRIDPENTGKIDFSLQNSFFAVAAAMIFTDSELDAVVNPDFVAYMRSHSFEPTNAQSDELRFHYLTRRPFLVGRGFSILSPDLCFDSIIDNTRFTLLEGADSIHAYKAVASARFLDKIVEIAKPYGYVELKRDVDLMDGKKKLGDLDLILFNKLTHHTLLVEGKNHALPLAVYFGLPDAIDDHITRTQDWEKKVKMRIRHLKSDSSSYKVSGNWDYIVVSRMPEPLAHCTDLFVLCLDEFKQWISKEPRDSRFEDFCQRIYRNGQLMSMEEMKYFQENGYFMMRSVE